MTTAERLTQIAGNVQNVYDSGIDSGRECMLSNLDDLKSSVSITDLSNTQSVDITQYGGQASTVHDGFYNFGADFDNFGSGSGTIFTAAELTTPKQCTITAYGNGNYASITINGQLTTITDYTSTPFVFSGLVTSPISFDYQFGECDIKVDAQTSNPLPSGTELYNALWDSFQNSGNRTNYRGMISQGSSNVPNPGSFGGWMSKYIIPKYVIKPLDSYGIFSFCENLIQAPTVDFTITTKIDSAFFKCESLKRVGPLDLPSALSFGYTFLRCSNLETISSIYAPKVTDWTKAFMQCPLLKNITFAADIIANIDLHWSTLLTPASLTNIVTKLSATATGKTLTLPTTAVGKIDSSLLASKTNWTIAYL